MPLKRCGFSRFVCPKTVKIRQTRRQEPGEQEHEHEQDLLLFVLLLSGLLPLAGSPNVYRKPAAFDLPRHLHHLVRDWAESDKVVDQSERQSVGWQPSLVCPLKAGRIAIYLLERG